MGQCQLLDRKVPDLSVDPDGFVDAAIGAAADEANNFVPIEHADFALVGCRWHFEAPSQLMARGKVRWVLKGKS